MIEQLKEFIAIKTVANNDDENKKGIEFVTTKLKNIGFEVSLEGDSPTGQPVVVAKYSNNLNDKKVVLYGHYDVEKIHKSEKWETPPFELIEKDGRYYCRGIADNKGILLSRIIALEEMHAKGEVLPNILWIIQGEEEVAGNTPFEVIPPLFEAFQSKLYVEETGVHKKDTPVVFYLPKSETPPVFLQELSQQLYDGHASLQNRQLNKFTKCPFVTNIPDYGYYIGFGPNDGSCRIHRDNESLNIEELNNHIPIFQTFIRWVNQSKEI